MAAALGTRAGLRAARPHGFRSHGRGGSANIDRAIGERDAALAALRRRRRFGMGAADDRPPNARTDAIARAPARRPAQDVCDRPSGPSPRQSRPPARQGVPRSGDAPGGSGGPFGALFLGDPVASVRIPRSPRPPGAAATGDGGCRRGKSRPKGGAADARMGCPDSRAGGSGRDGERATLTA